MNVLSLRVHHSIYCVVTERLIGFPSFMNTEKLACGTYIRYFRKLQYLWNYGVDMKKE